MIARWYAHRLGDLAGKRDEGDAEAGERLQKLVAWLTPDDGSPGEVWLAGNVAKHHARQYFPALLPLVSNLQQTFDATLEQPTPLGDLFTACKALREAIDRDTPPETDAIREHAAELERLAGVYEEKWRSLVEAETAAPDADRRSLRNRRGRMMNIFYRKCGEQLLAAVYAGGLFGDAWLFQEIGQCLDQPMHEGRGNREVSAWLSATQQWLPKKHPGWGKEWNQYPDWELDADLSATERTGKAELLRMRAMAGLLREDATKKPEPGADELHQLAAEVHAEREQRANAELISKQRYENYFAPYDAVWLDLVHAPCNPVAGEPLDADWLLERLTTLAERAGALDTFDGGTACIDRLRWLPDAVEGLPQQRIDRTVTRLFALAIRKAAEGVLTRDDAAAVCATLTSHPGNELEALYSAKPRGDAEKTIGAEASGLSEGRRERSQSKNKTVRQAITELTRLRDLTQSIPQGIGCGLFEFDQTSSTAENLQAGRTGQDAPLSIEEALALIDLGATAADITLGRQSRWREATCATPAVDRLVLLTAPTSLRAKATEAGRQPAIPFKMQFSSWTNSTLETETLIEVLRRGGKVLQRLAESGWRWSDAALLEDALPEVVWASLLADLSARGELLEPYADPWVYWEVEQACVQSCVVDAPALIASGFDERRRGTKIRSIALASTEAIDWLIGELESPPPAPQPADPPANAGVVAPQDEQPVSLAELVQQVPPLNRTNGAWLSNKKAAEAEGVETRTLAKYRSNGEANEDNSFGRDQDGRVWRREGTPGAHPWYQKSSLVSQRKP